MNKPLTVRRFFVADELLTSRLRLSDKVDKIERGPQWSFFSGGYPAKTIARYRQHGEILYPRIRSMIAERIDEHYGDSDDKWHGFSVRPIGTHAYIVVEKTKEDFEDNT